MTINLSALKKSSSKDLLAKLQAKVSTTDTKKVYEADARMWQPATDTAGNGSAVIRFLPATDEDNAPYVMLYTHGFKIGTKWFIENCPSTLGIKDQCPACIANSELWATGLESDKKIASERKRKLSYYANVMVMKDPANPENEGKVKIFRFGQKIFDKIKESINPDPDSGEESLDPFSFFSGANFIIKIAQVAGFKNYDKSKFASQTEMFDGDEDKLRDVLEQLHDIESIVAKDQFKSLADLQKKHDAVLGNTSATRGTMTVSETEQELPVKTKPAVEKSAPVAVESTEESDLEYFERLARGEV
jgi:hypothetical protein